jgi:hypothetical protein
LLLLDSGIVYRRWGGHLKRRHCSSP